MDNNFTWSDTVLVLGVFACVVIVIWLFLKYTK